MGIAGCISSTVLPCAQKFQQLIRPFVLSAVSGKLTGAGGLPVGPKASISGFYPMAIGSRVLWSSAASSTLGLQLPK